MKIAVFDCETIPSQSLPEGMRSEFAETVKTGSMKDQTKIDDKINKKMSLDPDLCEVVCFVGDKKSSEYWIGYPKDDEYHIIEVAWNFIKKMYVAHTPLVSYNGIQFDLPILLRSAMKLNIPVSPIMYADLTQKYNKHFVYHYDLMQILAGWDKSKYKPLNFYLKLFGIGEKMGDGSQVYEMWKKGEYDKIREYCQKDVELTAKLFERLEPWIVREI